MNKQYQSPENKSAVSATGDSLVALLSKYQAAERELDQAQDHLDRVTPPWPRMSPDDLTDEIIEQINADHLRIPAVADAQAGLDRALATLDTLLAQIVATPARSARGLTAKAKVAVEAGDLYVEEILTSLAKDAEALAA